MPESGSVTITECEEDDVTNPDETDEKHITGHDDTEDNDTVNKMVEKVMIRGGSSSDSGTDMMMVRCGGRQLHRTYRIDQTTVRENDSEDFTSNPSSPYSSLLDAPIPTVSSSSLLNFSQSSSEQTMVKQSSPVSTTRLQTTAKSGWI